MEAFLFLTDQEETDAPKRLVVVSTQHISEVRPIGHQMEEGAVVVMSNGHRIVTADTFAKVVQQLR